jgi:hypothetical protein
MGEKAGLIEDQLRHRCDVVDCGSVTVVCKPLGSDGIAIFRCFAKSKECLVATHTGTSNSESTDLSRRKIRGFEASRRLSKGAVTAAISTEHREGDEHLG